MISAGIGNQQCRKFLGSLNLQGPTKRNLKQREREVGAALETLSKDTCQHALQGEIAAEKAARYKLKSVMSTATHTHSLCLY